jgi:hypothetical protein
MSVSLIRRALDNRRRPAAHSIDFHTWESDLGVALDCRTPYPDSGERAYIQALRRDSGLVQLRHVRPVVRVSGKPEKTPARAGRYEGTGGLWFHTVGRPGCNRAALATWGFPFTPDAAPPLSWLKDAGQRRARVNASRQAGSQSLGPAVTAG